MVETVSAIVREVRFIEEWGLDFERVGVPAIGRRVGGDS